MCFPESCNMLVWFQVVQVCLKELGLLSKGSSKNDREILIVFSFVKKKNRTKLTFEY